MVEVNIKVAAYLSQVLATLPNGSSRFWKEHFVYFKWPRRRNALSTLPATAAGPENYNCTQQNLPFKNEIVPRRFRHGVRANLRLSPAGNIPTISLFLFLFLSHTRLVFLPGFPAPEAQDCDISCNHGVGSKVCYRCWHTLRGATRARMTHTYRQVLQHTDKKKKKKKKDGDTLLLLGVPQGQGERQTKQSRPENGRNVIPCYFPLAV